MGVQVGVTAIAENGFILQTTTRMGKVQTFYCSSTHVVIDGCKDLCKDYKSTIISHLDRHTFGACSSISLLLVLKYFGVCKKNGHCYKHN